MKKRWVGSGWKMNLLSPEVEAFCRDLRAGLPRISMAVEMFVVPAYPYLQMVAEQLKGTRVHVAAQNMHWEERGAYTGEVSPAMLRDVGVSLVELGHHERRTLFHESDEDINRKVHAALQHGLRPVICVGEAENVGAAQAAGIVMEQMRGALAGVSSRALREILFAYEPGWAIGTSGAPAPRDYVAGMHTALRRGIATLYGEEVAAAVPVLYGGSVGEDNAAAYLDESAVSGLFVGRAARTADGFLRLAEQADAKTFEVNERSGPFASR